MLFIDIVLNVYIFVALVVFLCYFREIKNFANAFKENGGENFKKRSLVDSAIKDSFLWPWYIFWYGFKSWKNDLGL
jgi:hypothetical protein